MIARRTKWFLILAAMAPVGLVGGLTAEWLYAKAQRSRYPQWRFIDGAAPWYIPVLAYVSLAGFFFSLVALISLSVDWYRAEARHARNN